jgi:hypothetical protein
MQEDSVRRSMELRLYRMENKRGIETFERGLLGPYTHEIAQSLKEKKIKERMRKLMNSINSSARNYVLLLRN